MTSAEPSPTRWLVAVPTGTEGPYSIDELRAHIRAGRVKPDDRAMDAISGRSQPITGLIPDAAELARGSERVRRRSTSDRHQAARDGSASEVRRFRTPLPGLPAAEDGPASAPHAPPLPGRLRRAAPFILTGLAAALVMLLVLAPASCSPPDPGLPPYAVWEVERIGTLRGPWRLDLGELGVSAMGPDGSWTDTGATIRQHDKHRIEVVLSTPRPPFGERFELRGPEPVMLHGSAGTGQAIPAR